MHRWLGFTGNTSTSASVYYSHALLLQQADTYTPDLVKRSLALSVRAYDRKQVTTLLESMGFTLARDNTAVYDRSASEDVQLILDLVA